jgi:CheY-like chemotaxis protein
MNEVSKILWVEDEEILRDLMCELLTNEGFHCTPASNGKEAIDMAKLRNHEFDCKRKTVPLHEGDFVNEFPGRHHLS